MPSGPPGVAADIAPLAPAAVPAIRIGDEAGDGAAEAAGLVPLPAANLLSLVDDSGHARPLDEIEAEVIRFALAHYRNQMSEVARRLRIGRSTLYRKLDTLGLAVADDAEV